MRGILSEKNLVSLRLNPRPPVLRILDVSI